MPGHACHCCGVELRMVRLSVVNMEPPILAHMKGSKYAFAACPACPFVSKGFLLFGE